MTDAYQPRVLAPGRASHSMALGGVLAGSGGMSALAVVTDCGVLLGERLSDTEFTVAGLAEDVHDQEGEDIGESRAG
jgi:hypothetical protein